MEVLRTKTVEQSVQDAEDSERGLRRTLGPVQLTAIGIWMVIGLVVYFGYSFRHSRLVRGEPRLPDSQTRPAPLAR